LKYNSLIIGLSVLALQSCTDSLIHTGADIEVVLTGNTYKAAFTESSPVSTFNSGNQILLNASGSLQIDNSILTYTDNQWKAENEFGWNDMLGKTTVTALYPVYPDLAYTRENLYKNNSLEDMLYVRDEFPAGKPIHLHFNHLFSLLTLRLSEGLQNDFQKIEVTCPAVISAIDPASAHITYAENERHTTSVTQASPSGTYSFVVPPAENISVTIDMETNGKKYTTRLETRSFAGNQEYTYHLKTSEKTPGIATAEDWIAFSQLINHNNITEYNGKTLADFGNTVHGVTTYYLLNDIDFTGVNCTALEQIGYTQTNHYFSQTFDGQGHTLSNIPIKSGYGSTGVFGATSATGIVRNLHIKSSNVAITSKTNSTQQGTGILVGRNGGKILNCSVKDCQITANPAQSNQSAHTGGIAGNSPGEIINCFVTNTRISYDSSSKIAANPAGGICGLSQGPVLNCYSANNSIKNKGSYNGGICGETLSGAHIENCYVYSIEQITTKGLLAGIADNSSFIHNFYDDTTTGLIGKNNGNNRLSGNIKYTNTFTDEKGMPVCLLLNEWIDQTAPDLYPDYTFTRWTEEGESLPAVFVSR